MIRFVLMFLLFFYLCNSVFANSSYAPPLKGNLFATSSFGEYRDGRFHMGVDFRAGIGTPVYAIDDGYVVRMRCGPWGYGRVLYIQFNSGLIGIYAHLNGFAEPYQSYLRKIQHQKKSFTIDENIPEKELPVSRGSIIAYTGRSGTKVPHLHFELRKKDGVTCVNPWEYGFQWIDRNTPKISSLLFVPGSADTVINGRCLPYEIPIQDKTAFPIVISAKGKLGVAIATVDPESGTCKLGPYQMTLKTTESVVSTIKQDLLDYNTYRDAKVAFYPYISENIYWVLWRWQGNKSPNYQYAKDTWISVISDEHIQVEVEDFQGEKITIPLYISENTPKITDKKKSGVYVYYLPNLITIEIILPPNATPEEPTVLCSYEEEKPVSLKPIHRSSNIYELPWEASASGKWTFQIIHPSMRTWEKTLYVVKEKQSIKPISIEDLQINISPASPYGVLWLSIDNVSIENLPQGLISASRAWKLEPKDAPIAEPVHVEMEIDKHVTPQQRIHLYRKTGSSWARVESKQNGNKVIASISDWGTFALIRDDSPPQISQVSIENNATVTSSKPEISCSISDVGSGIAKVEIYCDDRWLLAEYDGPRGILRWEQDEDLSKGTHQITFTVTDYAGLVKKEIITINVP